MQKVIFTSDMHITSETTHKLDSLAALVDKQKPDALFLLGDIFDAWIGWDQDPQLTKHVKTVFARMSQKTLIFFMAGNHDRLLGKKDAEIIHAKFLPDPSVITIRQKKYVLTHGDKLCTDDKVHQWWIKICEHRALVSFFRMWPLSWRKTLAKYCLNKAKEHKKITSLKQMDICQNVLERLLQKLKCKHIIHGHNHQPQIIDGSYHRYNMGSWDKGTSMYLKIDDTVELVS